MEGRLEYQTKRRQEAEQEVKEIRGKYLDQARWNHALIKTQGMLEKLQQTLAQNAEASAAKMNMMQ